MENDKDPQSLLSPYYGATKEETAQKVEQLLGLNSPEEQVQMIACMTAVSALLLKLSCGMDIAARVMFTGLYKTSTS